MDTYITKIVLQGFKSFNRKTVIPFSKGFTAIAGPNGAGKSNIVDAITFVLGKISAKSLRAERLQKLIYDGAGIKKGAQQAVVHLYFDNKKRVFPFEQDEIVITRKINKKGISVYKLNGRTTTRDKILQTLSIAKIRPDGYNIVYQGDATRILDMNAIERRKIIDEISGIEEYNRRKERALLDLQKVDEKLSQAEIIYRQKLENLKKVEKERNAALKYEELKQKIAIIKASIIQQKIKELQKKREKLLAKQKSFEEFLINIKEKLEEVENKLAEKEADVAKVLKQILKFSKQIEKERERIKLQSQIELNKSLIENYKNEIERIKSNIEKLRAIEEKSELIALKTPRPVREILKLNLKGVYGTIKDVIKVPEKFKTAIEVAAGNHLFDIIVEDEDVAMFCISYLKEEKIGKANFIPLNKITTRKFVKNELLKYDGVLGLASDLIKYDIKFLKAINFVFGNTLIVKDLETAKRIGIGKARMVTLDGDLIELSGYMSGGYSLAQHPKTMTKKIEEEIKIYLNQKQKLEKELENLERITKELEEKVSKIKVQKESYQSLEKVKLASELEIEKLKNKRKKLYEKKALTENKISELKIEIAKLEVELNSLFEEMKQYQNVKPISQDISTLVKMLRNYEQQLKQIGVVNLKAIQEYEEVKKDFEEYKQKYEKILEERKAVLKLIEEIEEKKKEVFMKTLNQVSSKFAEVFYKLTGGNAVLQLEDDDINKGLIIKANPKGGRPINIDALSGGEKTITALAFIFALQFYKAAPFYVLDEVDAALDKENSKKFAQFVKNLSKNSQFIVITHNDQTLKFAEKIYGVTLENGESKILTVKLP